MKRRKLKTWVENLLIIVNMLCVIVFACDNYNLKSLVISNTIALIIFIIANYLLIKYSDLFKEEN